MLIFTLCLFSSIAFSSVEFRREACRGVTLFNVSAESFESNYHNNLKTLDKESMGALSQDSFLVELMNRFKSLKSIYFYLKPEIEEFSFDKIIETEINGQLIDLDEWDMVSFYLLPESLNETCTYEEDIFGVKSIVNTVYNAEIEIRGLGKIALSCIRRHGHFEKNLCQ